MAEKRGLLPRGILLLGGVAVVVAIGIGLLRVGPPPGIHIRPAVPVIGKRTPVTVEISEPGRGLSHVKIEFVQGERVESLAEKDYAYPSALVFWGARTARDTITVQVGRETISWLKAGQASIRVTAGRAGTWLRHPGAASQEIILPVRLSPPSLQVISTQTYVAQGGCEAVVYRVGESSVRDGVRAGNWWFPGYPLPGGSKGERFAFFAIPFDMNAPDARIVAVDAAENQAELNFIDQFFPKKFKEDTVDLSDAFIGKVVPEIMAQTPEVQDRGDMLGNYLAINVDLRQKDAELLKDLAKKSRPELLWNKPFLSMKNGKVMAGFADYRTYSYKGKIVDHQTHLGYDLAVTRHAPVPAANDGVVVQAKYFGIYGNSVIVDHGCGVMSLYGHLSSIGVAEGQKVARGDIIGQTGETGLAGGDHLHFAVILDGLPVNPVEWWDGHWINDRIARKLGPGFHFSE
ncbi:MAG: M23 family metallopeptidase [Acidobacteriia bacterium]|nr:M23 family metallopeptidase [Terriglobia bacterium]